MVARKDITPGERFHRLTITREADPIKSGTSFRRMAEARCDCGVVRAYLMSLLRSGITKSCGCWRVEMPSTRAKHGYAPRGRRPAAYTTWANMIRRCADPKNSKYAYYGGRGIKVCDRWNSFENFIEDMGDPPKGMTLDRFPDVNGNYEPGNCRWATRTEQNNNTRRNHFIEYQGETMTISQWERRLGFPSRVLHQRITAMGWPIERAMTTPPQVKTKK